VWNKVSSTDVNWGMTVLKTDIFIESFNFKHVGKSHGIRSSMAHFETVVFRVWTKIPICKVLHICQDNALL
jgi:hypothetical protein